MPDLEQLTLDQLSIASEETKLFNKVPLAQLKSITLRAPTIRTAVTFFAHLVLPVDVKTDLNLTQVEGPQSFSDLFSAMERDPDACGSVIRFMRAIISYVSIDVRFSTSTPFASRRDDDTRLLIHFTWDSSAAVQPDIVFDICRIVTQGKIQSLSVSSSRNLSEYFWRTGSADLRELEVIHLKRSSIESLLDVLNIDDTRSSDIAYPSLRVLELDGIGFEDPEELRSIIAMRAKYGAQIHELRLVECRNLMAGHVELLEEVVSDVDWDYHEEPFEDSDTDSISSCHCPTCRD